MHWAVQDPNIRRARSGAELAPSAANRERPLVLIAIELLRSPARATTNVFPRARQYLEWTFGTPA